MRDRFIPTLITLIAGAAICIIDIYRKTDLLTSLKRLLLVLIIFYIIGLIARAIILRALKVKQDVSDEVVNSGSEEHGSEEHGSEEGGLEENGS